MADAYNLEIDSLAVTKMAATIDRVLREGLSKFSVEAEKEEIQQLVALIALVEKRFTVLRMSAEKRQMCVKAALAILAQSRHRGALALAQGVIDTAKREARCGCGEPLSVCDRHMNSDPTAETVPGTVPLEEKPTEEKKP